MNVYLQKLKSIPSIQVWRKTYAETVQGFDFDPFNAANVAFRCLECVLFVDDFHPTRAPTSSGKKFFVVGPSAETTASPMRQPTEVTSPGSKCDADVDAAAATTPTAADVADVDEEAAPIFLSSFFLRRFEGERLNR